MPKLDGTGPMGSGPKTGRGLGLCSKYNYKQTIWGGIGNWIGGFGRGRGRGLGLGKGRKFGRGGMFNNNLNNNKNK